MLGAVILIGLLAALVPAMMASTSDISQQCQRNRSFVKKVLIKSK